MQFHWNTVMAMPSRGFGESSPARAAPGGGSRDVCSLVLHRHSCHPWFKANSGAGWRVGEGRAGDTWRRPWSLVGWPRMLAQGSPCSGTPAACDLGGGWE